MDETRSGAEEKLALTSHDLHLEVLTENRGRLSNHLLVDPPSFDPKPNAVRYQKPVRPDDVKVNLSPMADMIPMVLTPWSRLAPSMEAHPERASHAATADPSQHRPTTPRMTTLTDPDVERIRTADREGGLVRRAALSDQRTCSGIAGEPLIPRHRNGPPIAARSGSAIASRR